MKKTLHAYIKIAFVILLLTSLFGTFNSDAQVCFTPAVNYMGASILQFGSVADFNGDGNLDLAVPNSSSVIILLGNGTGGFGAPVTLSAGSNSQSVIAADFNKDGKTDLAMTSYGSGSLIIMFGNGNGTFSSFTTYPVGTNPYTAITADFNNDGELDLAVTNQNNNNIAVLLGSGGGTFSAGVNFPIGHGPVFLTHADFNSDGKVDLAAVNRDDNTVSVLLGNGAGSFGAASTFAVGTEPFGIISADFNGDGKPDLATSNVNGSSVSVLLGDGAGGFAAVVNYPVGTNPTGIAFADFNGDGKTDIVTSNEGSGNVSVLLGDGTGSFAAAINFSVPNYAKVIAADLNNDGKPDLLTTNWGSGDVSVLLNTSASVSILTSDTTVCVNSPVQINAIGNSACTWTFSSSGNLSCDTCHNPVATAASTTTFTVTSSAGNCVAKDSIVVTVSPGFALSINPTDTTVCDGATVIILSSGAVNYEWSPSATLSCSTCANPSAMPAVTTTYTLIASDGVCRDTGKVIINIGGGNSIAGIVTALRDTICSGTPANLSVLGSAGAIQWESSIDGNNFSAIASATNTTYIEIPSQTIFYRVAAGSGFCADTSVPFKLVVAPSPVADYEYSRNNLTITFTDKSQGATFYDWNFGDNSVISHLQNPIYTYSTSGVYHVCFTVKNGSNCSFTICRDIDVIVNGIEKINSPDEWKIYPFPFSDYLFIEGKSRDSRIESIEICDVLGRWLLNKDFTSSPGFSQMKLDVSMLSRGVYYLMIKSAKASQVYSIIK